MSVRSLSRISAWGQNRTGDPALFRFAQSAGQAPGFSLLFKVRSLPRTKCLGSESDPASSHSLATGQAGDAILLTRMFVLNLPANAEGQNRTGDARIFSPSLYH